MVVGNVDDLNEIPGIGLVQALCMQEQSILQSILVRKLC